MKFILLALSAVWLAGCASAPARFVDSTFTVEVPYGWKSPEISQRDGVTTLSLRKEMRQDAFVQVQCHRYGPGEPPGIETLAAELEAAAGLGKVTSDRTVADLLGLMGSGVQRSVVARSDGAKRFHYLVFLPNRESRLAGCAIVILSTDITSETDVDRVIRSLNLNGKG